MLRYKDAVLSYLKTLIMRVPYIYGKYKTSLWPQMPRRQVGAEPSVDIMIFHVQYSIIRWESARVLPNFIEILSKADDTTECCLPFSIIIISMLRVNQKAKRYCSPNFGPMLEEPRPTLANALCVFTIHYLAVSIVHHGFNDHTVTTVQKKLSFKISACKF